MQNSDRYCKYLFMNMLEMLYQSSGIRYRTSWAVTCTLMGIDLIRNYHSNIRIGGSNISMATNVKIRKSGSIHFIHR